MICRTVEMCYFGIATHDGSRGNVCKDKLYNRGTIVLVLEESPQIKVLIEGKIKVLVGDGIFRCLIEKI